MTFVDHYTSPKVRPVEAPPVLPTAHPAHDEPEPVDLDHDDHEEAHDHAA